MMTDIKRYKLEAAFANLIDFDHHSEQLGFIEITLWDNGEGFDVVLHSGYEQRFGLTWGQFKAIKKLIKELDQ